MNDELVKRLRKIANYNIEPHIQSVSEENVVGADIIEVTPELVHDLQKTVGDAVDRIEALEAKVDVADCTCVCDPECPVHGEDCS